MDELPADKKGGREGGIHPLERVAQDALLFSFSGTNAWLENAFVTQLHSLPFSSSNRRQGGPIHTRIDRFYVGDWALERGGFVFTAPGVSTSDHFSMVLIISDSPQRERYSSIKTPHSFYVKESLIDEVLLIWGSVTLDSLHSLDLFASALSSMSLSWCGQVQETGGL